MSYKDPTIHNVTLTLADTEYSQVILDEASKVLIRSRDNHELKLAYTEGESGTNFITIPAGSGGKWLEGLQLKGKTLYIQSPSTGGVVEIEIWK